MQATFDVSKPDEPDIATPPQASEKAITRTFALPDGSPYSLCVGLHGTDAYTCHIADNGGQDPDWKLCMALLRPGSVFFDLGANIGVFTVPAAVLGATAHAFELLPSNTDALCTALDANGAHGTSVTLGAVWNRGGALGFAGSSAWGRLDAAARLHMATVRIDDYVQQHQVARVDVMKVDVEGAERSALMGARQTVERDHPDLVIEANSLTCGGAGYSCHDLLRTLSGWNYAIYRIGPGVLHPWPPGTVQDVILVDYLATTRTPGELAARTGWPVRPITREELTDNILRQSLYNDFHRLHVLAVQDRLPPEIRTDPRVASLLASWQPLATEEAMAALRVGTAP